MADHQDSKAPTTIVMAKVPKFEISPAASAYGVHDIELVALDELPSEPETPRSKLRLFAILTGIYLAMFISAIDQAIIATAIPTITHDLNSSSGYVWIGGAYLLATAASGPIWAKFSDIFGRKPIILTANALFIASSIFCALSSSMAMLIVGRSFQGMGSGGLVQLVMITISDLFSIRSRSLYIGLMELVWIVAGGAGPALGGAFTEKLSWRWNFWINVPVAGLTFLLLFFYLDVHNPRTPILVGLKAIDWFGSLSITGLAIMVLLGLQFGGSAFAWNSPEVICLIIFGSLMSLFFVYSEKRLAQYPIMPLALFTNWSNAASLLLTLWHGMVYIGAEYYLPLYFQSARGSSPFESGLLVMPITVTEAIMAVLTGLIIHRTGRYLELIYFGVALLIIGNGLFTLLSPTSSVAEIICFQIIAGIGGGPLFQTPLIALQADISQDDTATATATFGFVRNMANSLSVIIAGVLFQNSMNVRVASLAEPPVNLPSGIVEMLSGGAAAANVMLANTIEDPMHKSAVRDAYSWSVRNIWILYTCLAALAVVASLFIKKHHLREEHVETKTGLKKKEGESVK